MSLEPRLPRLVARTNGFAGAGILRGWFRVEGLGEGKLFVDLGCSPYVLVRLRRGFLIVNFSDPRQTRALYRQIQAARARSMRPCQGDDQRLPIHRLLDSRSSAPCAIAPLCQHA